MNAHASVMIFQPKFNQNCVNSHTFWHILVNFVWEKVKFFSENLKYENIFGLILIKSQEKKVISLIYLAKHCGKHIRTNVTLLLPSYYQYFVRWVSMSSANKKINW